MTTQVRIGDAERDAAAAALGDHYAAGRLTKTEYDERVDQVWAAWFQADLDPVFADLPRPRAGGSGARPSADLVPGRDGADGVRRIGGRSWQLMPHPAVFALPLLWIMPVAVIALIVVAIVVGAPWLLFMLLWFCAFSGFGSRQRHRARSWHPQHH